MGNIKIPYLVYPLVFGLMAGWLSSCIIARIFASPRPLPIIKKQSAASHDDTKKIAEQVIADNIFRLAVDNPTAKGSSQGAAGSGSVQGTANGTDSAGSTGSLGGALLPDGTINPNLPPPPFTAKLLGVLKDFAGAHSIAIIKTDDGTVCIKLGAEKKDIKVCALDSYSAVVERDKKLYTIILEKGDNSKGRSNQNNKQTASPEQVQAGSNINITLERNDVRSELKDLNKILQSALISPYYQSNEFAGYIVTRIKQDSPLLKLGLQQGDTITRINGNELKSPELLFNMLSQVDDISAITIDMIRKNEKKTIFVEIK